MKDREERAKYVSEEALNKFSGIKEKMIENIEFMKSITEL